jgi:hypothetical protein
LRRILCDRSISRELPRFPTLIAPFPMCCSMGACWGSLCLLGRGLWCCKVLTEGDHHQSIGLRGVPIQELWPGALRPPIPLGSTPRAIAQPQSPPDPHPWLVQWPRWHQPHQPRSHQPRSHWHPIPPKPRPCTPIRVRLPLQPPLLSRSPLPQRMEMWPQPPPAWSGHCPSPVQPMGPQPKGCPEPCPQPSHSHRRKPQTHPHVHPRSHPSPPT